MILNELHLTYRLILLNFGTGPSGMKTPYFESINPNGRIPALIDHSVPGIESGNGLGIPVGWHPSDPDSRPEGEERVDADVSADENEKARARRRKGGLVVWESGACITYLARKYDTEYRLWARALEEQSQIETWVSGWRCWKSWGMRTYGIRRVNERG